MVEERRLVSVVSKLNRLTQEGKIQWERREPPDTLTSGTDSIIGVFYCTTYEGRNIGVYEERYQAFGDDYEERFCWSRHIGLAFFSEDWKKIWEFPLIPGKSELLEAVQYHAEDIDVALDEILKENEED